MTIRPILTVPDPILKEVSKPVDAVTDETRALCENNYLIFLHVSRAEVDLPPDTDPYDDRVYALAKQTFDGLFERGILFREAEPSLYVYRQEAVLGGLI